MAYRDNNYSYDDIDKLEKSIEQDGWFTHQNLLINWRYKKLKVSSLLFSDQTGTYFGSCEKVLKALKKFPEKNVHEISLLFKFQL